MDEKDRKILDILKQDSNLTTRQIAKKVNIPITTVHNRIKKLEERGIIKRYTLELDHKKIGNTFAAQVLLSCDYDRLRTEGKDQHQLARELSRFEEVERVDIITGKVDMLLRVRTKDVDAYDEFLLEKLQAIPGVDQTQTLVIIHESD